MRHRPEIEQDPQSGAVYVKLRDGVVSETVVLVQDCEVMADLDGEGNVLGIEIL